MPEIEFDPKLSEQKMPMPSPAFVWLAAIICSFHWRLFGVFPYMDFSDEAYYMGRVGGRLSSIDWAMPYSLWYKCWHFLTGDSLLSFRLNGIFLSAALVFLGFAILRKLNTSQIWAALAGSVLVFWEPMAGSPVKVSHFYLLLQLIAVLASLQLLKKSSERFLLFGACSLWFCFVRQESLVIALGAFVCSGLALAVERRGFRSGGPVNFYRPLQLSMTAAVALLAFSPFTAVRSWLAFRDHFCWGHGQPVSDGFVKQFFPTAQTISGALLENPGAFFAYGKKNLLNFAMALPAEMAAHYPGWVWQWWLIGFAFAAGVILGRKEFVAGFLGRIKNDAFIFLFGLASIALFQAIVVCFLFQYDIKYSLSALVFAFLVIFYAFDPLAKVKVPNLVLLLGAPILLAMPWVLPPRAPVQPYRWYYQSDVKEENELILRWRDSARLRDRSILQFREYTAYFRPRLISQMSPGSFSVMGIQSAGAYLDYLRSDFILFAEKDRPICRAAMGEVDCSALLGAVDKCFSVLDSVGRIKLLERKSTCATVDPARHR